MATTAARVQGAPSAVAPHKKFKLLGCILSVAVPLAFWFAPLGLSPKVQHTLAVAIFMIVAWITEAMEHGVTGLIGCYLFWALHISSFATAFSGFANDTTWFLVGAFLFGAMASKTGLARRVAYLIMAFVGSTYSRILLGLIISDFALTFFVTSAIARVVIMASIALGLMEAFDLPKGSNVGRGMFMILTYVANIFDKMIIAGASSILARGGMVEFGHVEVLYSRWFLAFLPCSIITIFAAWRLTLWLYPPEKAELPGGAGFFRDELKKMGKWTVPEKKAAVLMMVALVLWFTDFWHHQSPSLIGIGIGLVALLPVIGVLDHRDLREVNYLPVFFVAAALSMGNVLVANKALDVLTNFMFAWMTPMLHTVLGSTMVLYWTAFIYHIFLASELSMLGTSIPLLMKFSLAHHLDPLAIGMIWTFGAGAKIFLYQSGVMVVGYSYGYFETKDMFKVGAWMSLIEAAILLLLVPLYWTLPFLHV